VPPLLLMTDDPDVVRFTRVPAGADETFARAWIRRYEGGWEDGSRAGFAILAPDGGFLGFAAVIDLDLAHREGEIGYMVAPAARGRGIAPRAVELLTRWGFDELGLIRLELRIDVRNSASERVAERSGYRRDGVLRNIHFKEGLRCDLAVWSRLSQD
jgi:RimJ/RimL family protein N-acetyltransferase